MRTDGVLTAAAISPEMKAWANRFAREAARDAMVEAFVQKVDAVIIKQVREIAEDPILIEDLHNSTRSQWYSFVGALTQEHRLSLPTPAAWLARSLARRGMDLGVLLKVYRAAHQVVFQFFTEVTDGLGDDAPPRDELLVFMWTRAEQWMDDSVENLIEMFYDERQHVSDGALARRTEVIEALLKGAPAGGDVSATLGHGVHQWQTGFVVWSQDPAEQGGDLLVEAAHALASALQAPAPLTLMAGSRDLWCWVATPGRPELSALRLVGESLAERGLRIAVGIPGEGVSGFRTSHTEARAAQRLAMAATVTAPLVDYDEVELLCLAAGNEDLLQRMVDREIGALCRPEKNLGPIRDTALAYLTNCQNVEATADQLFVHKNTVRYRLARAEDLLGYTLSERAPRIELALRYVALFGPPRGPA